MSKYWEVWRRMAVVARKSVGYSLMLEIYYLNTKFLNHLGSNCKIFAMFFVSFDLFGLNVEFLIN
jgi:hypothetical protein